MKPTKLGMWIIGLSYSVISGCGGDSDGGGGGAVGGVARSRLLVDLTTEENARLCSFYERLYKDSLQDEEHYCAMFAIEFAWSTDDCEREIDACVATTDYENEIAEDWECDRRGLVYGDIEGDCSATVADLEACLREDVERDAAFGTKYTCEDAGEDFEEITQGIGPACADMFAKCPGADF